MTTLLGCPDCKQPFGVFHLPTCARVRGMAGPVPVSSISPGPFELLDDLRNSGWRVAAMNDYMLRGASFHFWLLTHPAGGVFVKGEGATDLDALRECVSEIKRRHLTYIASFEMATEPKDKHDGQ